MKPVEIMMNEHRTIEKVLSALEKAVNKLESGDQVPAQFFYDAVDFIQNYADGAHHNKEEDILFKILLDEGQTKEEEPLRSMFTEHDMGRHFTKNIKLFAGDMELGDKHAVKNIISNAKNYVTLLRLHIKREDTEVFPWCFEKLSDNGLTQFEQEFELEYKREIEAHKHDEYSQIATKLEQEIS